MTDNSDKTKTGDTSKAETGTAKPAASSAATSAGASKSSTASSSAKPDAKGAAKKPDAGKAKPAPKKKKGGGGIKFLFYLILLLAIVGGLGWLTLPIWKDKAPAELQGYINLIPMPPQGENNAAALKAELDNQKSTLADLAGRVKGVAAQTAALDERLTALENAPKPEPQLTFAPTPAPAPAPAPVATDEDPASEASNEDGDGAGDAESDTEMATETGQEGDTPAIVSPVGPDPAVIAELQSQNDQLLSMVNTLAARLAQLEEGSVDAAAMLGLSERIAAAETMAKQASTTREESGSLVLAVAQLREAVNRGEAFTLELDALAAMTKGDADMAEQMAGFESFAASGLPNAARLIADFKPVSRAAAQAAIGPEGKGFWDETVRELTSIVTIRKVDGKGDGPLDLIAKAEKALKGGDLAKAADLMGQLEGRAAEQSSDWVAKAKARVAADTGLSALTAQALALSAQ